MPPILGAKKLYSKIAIAITINVPMNAIIGQTMIKYRAPIPVIEAAIEFTTAAVSGFKLIIMVLIWYIVAYPIMKYMIPAINDKIKAITDIIKEISNTGKDFTSLIMGFPFLTSSI